MSEFSDMLSKQAEGGDNTPASEEMDAKKAASVALKNFWDSMQRGEHETAAEHFGSAMEHCQRYMDGEGSGGDGESEPEAGTSHGIGLLLMRKPQGEGKSYG